MVWGLLPRSTSCSKWATLDAFSERDIGAFLGLCPKRDQSGETDKELRISKCGDRYLRRLLELPSHGSRESFKLVQGADARAA